MPARLKSKIKVTIQHSWSWPVSDSDFSLGHWCTPKLQTLDKKYKTIGKNFTESCRPKLGSLCKFA